MIKDFIHDSNKKDKILKIISLDQKKAFDNILHSYLFKLLKNANIGNRLIKIIENLYNDSITRLNINGILLEEIKVKKSIKQGDPLSMWLYILALQELLISIKNNKVINGYKLNILSSIETKTRAYADDIGGTLIDDVSIKELFIEFEKQGKYSGGEINKNKTKILNINGIIDKDIEHLCVDEIKILGVKFNKNGISCLNVKEIYDKIDISLNLWNFKEFDMLQRITALKTFILSKLWFILNFIYLDKNEIMILERKIYKYLWSNKQELIKRATLIRSKKEGGLDMIDINSKMEAIRIKQYLYILNNYNKIEYQYSLKWLKFKMRNFISNINIIPYEPDYNDYYENIITTINKNRSVVEEIINKNMFMNLKSIYEMIKKKNEIKPKIEENCLLEDIDWNFVYKKVLFKMLQSKMKVFNYKLLFAALSSKEKFYKTGKCDLCFKEINEIIFDHLYFKCPKLCAYGEIYLQEDLYKRLNKNNLVFFKNINEKEICAFTTFELDIWNLYIVLKHQSLNINELIRIFKTLQNKLKF